MLRQQNKIERCITELTTFLDTFYSDLEAWLELADVCASLNLYVGYNEIPRRNPLDTYPQIHTLPTGAFARPPPRPSEPVPCPAFRGNGLYRKRRASRTPVFSPHHRIVRLRPVRGGTARLVRRQAGQHPGFFCLDDGWMD